MCNWQLGICHLSWNSDHMVLCGHSSTLYLKLLHPQKQRTFRNNCQICKEFVQKFCCQNIFTPYCWCHMWIMPLQVIINVKEHKFLSAITCDKFLGSSWFISFTFHSCDKIWTELWGQWKKNINPTSLVADIWSTDSYHQTQNAATTEKERGFQIVFHVSWQIPWLPIKST